MKKLSRVKHPEIFQGNKTKADYFEGWYFKHVTQNGAHVFSIIPGVNFENKKQSAFIQILIGPEFKSFYITYDIKRFLCSDTPFSIKMRATHRVLLNKAK